MDHIDTCVIGGGVVGLAIGRAFALLGQEVLVLDREAECGQGISSRNSEVIHAGIYYPRDSLKAKMCVSGKHLLYEYCSSRAVGHRNCGKLIVATTPEEEEDLADILVKAQANGVDDLAWWSKSRLVSEEPEVKASLALFSPSTGIVSSHELMQALLADMEGAGGTFAGSTRVVGGHRAQGQFVIRCETDGDEYRFSANRLINSAGLGAQQVAAAFEFGDAMTIPQLYLCKGNYFTMSGRNPFRHLIYPVPERSGAGLGVHATIDLGGQVKFGPDVEYVEEEDYVVSDARVADYYVAVRGYFPSLEDGQLSPGYVGIRPKLQGPGEPPRDFVIQGESEHGVQNLIQLYGIESPGLTSSLAIAEYVVEKLSASD